MRAPVTDAVAIIGMSGRFPGAPTIDSFWDNLRHGVESVTPFTADQLRESGVDEAALLHPGYVPMGTVLDDVDLFDAAFFGISPREAESLDPQQRLFLEISWHALEDAGYDPATFPGQIGVYGGCATSTYLARLHANPEFMALLGYLQIHIGNDKDYLATRVSYALDLKGPSFSIQTACSTSLLAVALAGDHLLTHQCDMALAGGVCVRVPQETGYYHEPGGIFSPDGHCRVFDERAAGVVFGNGVGAVLLRRLSDAVADGDPIYAVVKGWAVNNDGSAKASYAAPSLEGQADVVARAHRHAGVSADTITYVEAHGTGTPVGDPIEIGALTKAFRLTTDRAGFCAVGSVKTNVGHLDPAAGVASLVKTVLALRHKELPPSLHCETVNPAIEFEGSPFFVNTECAAWPADGGPRRAGVSGFGIGGTNVHLVLEEAPLAAPREDDSRSHHVMALSARSGTALRAAADNLAEHLTLEPDVDPADLAYTLQVGRRPMHHRCAVVYGDVPDLVAALADGEGRRVLVPPVPPAERTVAYMLSGQGSQYVDMALGLYETEPGFREPLDRCAELLEPHLADDLRTLLYPAGNSARDLTQTAIAQPALFAVEYALAQLWIQWGVAPDAMIGHSIGEYVAACLAGVFSLADALALVAERGRLMQAAPPGSMAAVSLPEDELRPLIEDALDVAAVNEDGLCVVAGPTPDVEALEVQLAEQGVACQRLHTSHAFHSRMMDGVVEPFAERVAAIALAAPRIPYVSNLTGEWATDEQATSPEYWARHLRGAVRFGDGLRLLLEDPNRVLLEVGPGQALVSVARRHRARGEAQLVLPSLRHPREDRPDAELAAESLARLWLAGAGVDWHGVHSGARRRRVHLPVYPFERRRYWPEIDGSGGPPGVLKAPDVADWFFAPSWDYALAPDDPVPAASSWLVFDDGEVGPHVVRRLSESEEDITVVRAGSELAIGDGEWTIEPSDPGGYDALVERLVEAGRPSVNILHLWSVGDGEDGVAGFDHWQERGFYSILLLVQALLRARVTTPVQIVVGTTGLHAVTGDEDLLPAKATLLGLCRSVPQEHPHIACRCVDVVVRADDERTREQAAAQLVAESGDEQLAPTVAYRKGQRWLQGFEPISLDDVDAGFPFRRHGVYLVTGGLGNIGLALAGELARLVHARLVLVGRSAFPEPGAWDEWLAAYGEDDSVSRQILRVRALEELGAEVLVMSADVADPARMRAVVEKVVGRWGRLDGVIHGAGNVTDEGFFAIDEADSERCERQFESKVRGLIALEYALRDQRPDFVALLSSISSVLAGLGYVAYAGANAFMDAFAQRKAGAGETRWLSIDWDTWEFGGGEPTALSMDPDEGVDAFGRILSADTPAQLIVSTGWLPARIEQWIDLRSLRRGIELEEAGGERFHARPDVAGEHVEPRTAVEKSLGAIWEEVLGVRPVGAFDDFFADLGGNSLLAAQLMSRIRARLGVDVPLRRFFDRPTVADLAEVVGADVEEEELASAPG
jgi:acyl transferase domain-containing protein